MEQLTGDELRITALQLPIKDILNLCQTNKKFQQSICNSKPFWQALLLRQVGNTINIHIDADINWFKYRVRQSMHLESINKIVSGIKNNKLNFKSVFYNPYSDKWDNFEILDQLKELDCGGMGLYSLPEMENLVGLWCGGNNLKTLPLYPKLERLYCVYNKITSLPSYPNLIFLNCEINQLTSLPLLPKLKTLLCKANPLPSFDLEDWKEVWEI